MEKSWHVRIYYIVINAGFVYLDCIFLSMSEPLGHVGLKIHVRTVIQHTDRQIYANTILDMGTNRHDRRGVCSWYSSKFFIKKLFQLHKQ